MPEQQQPEGAPQGGEPNLPDLVLEIQKKLVILLKILDQTQVASPEAKSELAQIIQAYRAFVSEKLGESQGQEQGPPQGPAPQASVSPEAGANPNARPM